MLFSCLIKYRCPLFAKNSLKLQQARVSHNLSFTQVGNMVGTIRCFLNLNILLTSHPEQDYDVASVLAYSPHLADMRQRKHVKLILAGYL